MENATKALELAFGLLIFVVALSLSISTFSYATTAINNIISSKDKKQEYVYLAESKNENVDINGNRIVGIETIIPSLYKAYKENYRVIFVNEEGNPITLYYKTRNTSTIRDEISPGEYITVFDRETDENGYISINYIDIEQEVLASPEDAVQHLDFILYGQKYKDIDIRYYTRYKNQIEYTEGLYSYLSDKEFIEILGEYYQEDAEAGIENSESQVEDINKTKKRVITYKLYEQ